MNATESFFTWALRYILLFILFIVIFMIGALSVTGVMPDSDLSEPGLVSEVSGILIIALVNLSLIAALVFSSIRLLVYGSGSSCANMRVVEQGLNKSMLLERKKLISR